MAMEQRLRAGYGDSILTPELGAGLVGYGPYLDRNAEVVLDDLKARVVAVEDGRTCVVVIVCDLIGFTIDTSDAIRDRIAADLGVPRSHVMLSCTHTHSGPATLPFRAMAAVDSGYLEWASDSILSAVRRARADLKPADVAWARTVPEPIGHNRRRGTFEPIDPFLRTAAFVREDRTLHICAYSCHPVTLGASKAISADWPGATARAFELSGDRALVLQGYCGDIDPVTNRNAWGQGTIEDLNLMGHIICTRARKAAARAPRLGDAAVAAYEERIELPLDVPASSEALDAHREWWAGRMSDGRNARLIAEWLSDAQANRERAQTHPVTSDVPVAGLRIGGGMLVGLPGEVFSGYAEVIGTEGAVSAPVGFCNGDVGYIPTADAYADLGDYACYLAPKYYGIFAFRPDIETTVREALVRASRALAEDAEAV